MENNELKRKIYELMSENEEETLNIVNEYNKQKQKDLAIYDIFKKLVDEIFINEEIGSTTIKRIKKCLEDDLDIIKLQLKIFNIEDLTDEEMEKKYLCRWSEYDSIKNKDRLNKCKDEYMRRKKMYEHFYKSLEEDKSNQKEKIEVNRPRSRDFSHELGRKKNAYVK